MLKNQLFKYVCEHVCACLHLYMWVWTVATTYTTALFLLSFVSACFCCMGLVLVLVLRWVSSLLHLLPGCDFYLRIRFSYWLLFICAVRSFIEFALCLRGVQWTSATAAGAAAAAVIAALRPLRQWDSGGESRTESCRPSIVKVFVCYRAIIEVSNSNNKEQEK